MTGCDTLAEITNEILVTHISKKITVKLVEFFEQDYFSLYSLIIERYI